MHPSQVYERQLEQRMSPLRFAVLMALAQTSEKAWNVPAESLECGTPMLATIWVTNTLALSVDGPSALLKKSTMVCHASAYFASPSVAARREWFLASPREGPRCARPYSDRESSPAPKEMT